MDIFSSSDFDFAILTKSATKAPPDDAATAEVSTGGFAAAAKTGDRAAFDYVLDIIHSETLTPTQQVQVMRDTLGEWRKPSKQITC